MLFQNHTIRHRYCQYLHFFFKDPATTEIYTLSLHDALPIAPALHQDTFPETSDSPQSPGLAGRPGEATPLLLRFLREPAWFARPTCLWTARKKQSRTASAKSHSLLSAKLNGFPYLGPTTV